METKTKPRTEAEALFSDLDKPSLHALSYALRHPDTWPEGFYWDFSDCGQCAMGLAHELWNVNTAGKYEVAVSRMARAFAMPYGEARHIFGTRDWAEQRKMFGLIKQRAPWGSITPEMVADQIDAYLARAE